MCERKYGIELEGYVDSNLVSNVGRRGGFDFIHDGSLEDSGEECYNCNGSGEVEETCEDCGGDGYEECSYCDGCGRESEEEECSYCGGEGSVTCGNCCGECTQTVECSRCEGRGDEGEYGIEAVSDPLRFSHGKSKIEDIMSYLHDHNWTIREECGTHIHVDANDLSMSALQKLAILVHSIEPILFSSMSDRYDNTYCKPMDECFISDMYSNGDKPMSKQSFADSYYKEEGKDLDYLDKYDSERYYALNFHSYFYRGTVEFRYFGGMDNVEEIWSTINLCVSLVEMAKTLDYGQILFLASNWLKAGSLEEARGLLKYQLSLDYLVGTSYYNSRFTSLKNEAIQLMEHNNVELSDIGDMAV